MRADFPAVIDSTMRAAFVNCPQKFYREFIQQIAPTGANMDLHAGGAFADGIKATRQAYFERGCDSDLAIGWGLAAITRYWGKEDDFNDYVKSYSRVCFALLFYFEQYPMASDIVRPVPLGGGKMAIEVSFALPIPGSKHPSTGDPIIYAGRFDMLGVRDGTTFLVDEKTTKQLGPTWSNNWTLRSQFTGYSWGAREYGYPVAGAIIRGISFLKYNNETQQAIVYRPQWQIDRWLKQLLVDVERMKRCWAEGYWDFDLDTACSSYGGCSFMRLCDNSNPEALVEVYYQERIWDPLKHKP